MKEKRKERKDVKEMPKLSQTRFAIFEGCVKSKNMQIPRSHTHTHTDSRVRPGRVNTAQRRQQDLTGPQRKIHIYTHTGYRQELHVDIEMAWLCGRRTCNAYESSENIINGKIWISKRDNEKWSQNKLKKKKKNDSEMEVRRAPRTEGFWPGKKCKCQFRSATNPTKRANPISVQLGSWHLTEN